MWFYVLSFILLAPIGLFALAAQRPIKNKFIFVITLIIFSFKSFSDFVLFIGFVFAEKSLVAAIYYLLAAIILIFFYRKLYVSTSEIKETDNAVFNRTEIKNNQFNEKNFSEPYTPIDENIDLENTDLNYYPDHADISLESFKNISELKSVIKDHEETGEVFTFHYQKPGDTSSKLRNIVVLRLYSQNAVDYIDCLDIDENNTYKTFRVDRITEYKASTYTEPTPEILISEDEKKKLKAQCKTLKQSMDFIDQTNEIIFKLKNEVNIFKSLPEEEDIKPVLENKGFMLKTGRNIHVYDNNFNYVGSLNMNISKLKKMYPNLYFVSPFGIFSYNKDYEEVEITDKLELFTYSQTVIETIKTYDPKLYFEIKTKLKV